MLLELGRRDYSASSKQKALHYKESPTLNELGIGNISTYIE